MIERTERNRHDVRDSSQTASRGSGRREQPKRLCVEGLPRLDPSAIVRVTPGGDRLVIASGKTISTYAVLVESTRAVARRVACATLEGRTRDLALAPDGVAFVLVSREMSCDGGRIGVLRVEGDRTTTLASLDAPPTAVAATRRYLALAVPGTVLASPQLLVLRRRDGGVVRREPLATARVRLRAGPGDELLIVEQGGRMRRVDAAPRAQECEPSGGDRPCPDQPPREPPGTQEPPCGCPPCGRPPQRPPGGSGRRPPAHRDPHGQCVPGSDGDPGGCFVTSVVGGVVVVTNLCEPEEPPCTARLDWPAGSVARTRNTVVATSRDGQRVAILDGRTLRKLHVHRGGRQRVTALAARDSDRVFLRDDAGALTLLDVAPLVPAPAGPGLAPGFTLGTTAAVHDGQAQPLQYDKSGPQHGTRRVLMVPMLEPGQEFDGTTADMAQSGEIQDILATARSFYEETTRHNPPDHEGFVPEFLWFGADTPTLYTGPPLPLPLPWRLYWGPAWDPGAIRGTVPLPGGGLVLSFSGDETMELRALPAPIETYDPETFEVRFPAASYRARIPNSLATISLGPATAPARAITIAGTDRDGNPFAIAVDTNVLGGATQIDLLRDNLSSDDTQQQALADVIEEMLASAPGALFERPAVFWQDDGDEAGMLHVSLSFAASAGASAPVVTSFDLDALLPELGPGSQPALFDLPTDAGALATYLARIVADASVRHPDFGSDLDRSYFDFSERPPTVSTDGGELTVRINLSTNHGRYPAQIELESQQGLEKIGMDHPAATAGADTGFSGSGGPQFDADKGLFDEVYTRMIDAVIEQWGGDEAAAIAEFNRFFNCVGIEDSIECALSLIHNILVTPAFPTLGAGTSEPDIAELRGATRSMAMNDKKADERVAPVLQLAYNRSKIAMMVAPDSPDDPTRSFGSASTLAHELGHGLLGLPDLYDADGYRSDVQYVGRHCIMGSSSSRGHFCAYNQRIKGWLEDDATLLLDRPTGNETIDREVVLIQLEHWDPLLDGDARAALAQSLLPNMSTDTPVVAAVFLRLGGDGRTFDILELRGRGELYSQDIDPPRVLVTNAVDPDDDTRYAETELEGAGTTQGVLEAYRRKVHLLSSGLRVVGDTYDFASNAEFPEVGLSVEVLEWGTDASGTTPINATRVRIRWDRGPFIDLGFSEGIPDWTSPDIAVIPPDQIADDGSFEFPESQEEGFIDTYVPAGNEGTLDHKVAVRVWNFGDATALNVQLELVLRLPEGSGDWKPESVIGSRMLDEVPPTPEASDAPIVEFDWPVTSAVPAHVCFRAQIGDRDVPRDSMGNAEASDDTNAHNDWAQQNVSVLEAPADSPPDPVEFTYQVNNGGSYVEEVWLVPRGLRDGARVTITPARLRIRPRSRGLFRVRVDLEERLLDLRCGKDVEFLLEAIRVDEHAEARWGAVKYIVKPRRRTATVLNGHIMFERVNLLGHVSPDVGAQRVLFHLQRPGQPSLWQRETLGPASTFDVELPGPWPSGETVLVTARFEGTNEFASSVSETLELVWLPEQ